MFHNAMRMANLFSDRSYTRRSWTLAVAKALSPRPELPRDHKRFRLPQRTSSSSDSVLCAVCTSTYTTQGCTYCQAPMCDACFDGAMPHLQFASAKAPRQRERAKYCPLPVSIVAREASKLSAPQQ
jgi:hypothetical protein